MLLQISFLLPTKAIPGRVAILLTLFLCAVNTLNSSARDSPKLGGVPTALDKWIIMCLIFILMAFLEYAWIMALQKYCKTVKQVDAEAACDAAALSQEMAKWSKDNLDKVAMAVFPSMFLVATYKFWTGYMY